MKLYGIGTDIVNVDRVKKSLTNKKFLKKIFNQEEISKCTNKRYSVNCFAKRFAAKEAFWKAISPDRGDGIAFKEIETLNDQNGKPYLYFSGKTEMYIKNKEQKLNSKFKFDISLSDEPPYVLAFVVIYLAPNA